MSGSFRISLETALSTVELQIERYWMEMEILSKFVTNLAQQQTMRLEIEN